jgi:16S rRNA (guanine527-N7)-methyltransferase
VAFRDELDLILPHDLPNRKTVVDKSARHLELIVDANQYLNLTRIVSPRDAAIKHVLDSVLPWRLVEGAEHVLDAGTGAGFPGIPLALVLPGVRFTLAESIQKKARFVESALAQLGIPNAAVSSRRAEDFGRDGSIGVVTARAFAPLPKALELLGPVLKTGARALLYKGPDIEREMADAAREAKKLRATMEVRMRYDLPDSLGGRTICEVRI